MSAGDSIAAIATPAGRGGIGVVRVSGRGARAIGAAMLGELPPARVATLRDFRAARGELIDRGLVLFFPAPRSYTGEDVLELQAQGGPMVMRQILARCVEAGARLAEPGEFTRRAFLNGRIDLAQAESVADLIDAASEEAARSAARSLAGEFSQRVHAIVGAMTDLRMHVEACIDFPEEEIDPADRAALETKRVALAASLEAVLDDARQGAVLRDGLTVVLAGAPNVGKSSLLNRLAGEEVAIVTAMPGTTRDYVRATIAIEGVPIHLIDTAGLRDTDDPVERIGVERAWQAIERAGAALLVESAVEEGAPIDTHRFPHGVPRARVVNKIDLAGSARPREARGAETELRVSAKTGEGIAALRAWLLDAAGWRPHGEGLFMARQRHLEALEEAKTHVTRASEACQAFDLMAEELRLGQRALGRITGEVSADELLGAIFSRFCIGK
ncbi:MAG TPA: tRNA uridine-5-carboxymethylaminomethyl(34) synthesis GTPase MnmE [Usitatibacter sp.]|nr:tRNA uridine-5-carboxymethylaminomethyl(34) synthesis GTPase MnmE [Usitatibacter sp.]